MFRWHPIRRCNTFFFEVLSYSTFQCAHSKDSGAAIPGIGGTFDLSDSIILAAPVGYLLFRLP